MIYTDYKKRSNFSVILNAEITDNKKTELPKLIDFLNFTANGLYEKTTFNLNDPETFNLAFEFLRDYDFERPFKPNKSIFEYWTVGKAILRKKTMIQINNNQNLEQMKVGVGPRKEANTNPSNPPGKEGS